MDYYVVLGLQRGASNAEVKRAYRRLARAVHPDHNAAADANERFREIAEAYDVLSDRALRTVYDQVGHATFVRDGYARARDRGHWSEADRDRRDESDAAFE